MLILRPTTIYGPNELIVPNTPSGFLRKAIDNRGISLWGDGSEIRDFLFIEDLVEIISKIRESEEYLLSIKYDGHFYLLCYENNNIASTIFECINNIFRHNSVRLHMYNKQYYYADKLLDIHTPLSKYDYISTSTIKEQAIIIFN